MLRIAQYSQTGPRSARPIPARHLGIARFAAGTRAVSLLFVRSQALLLHQLVNCAVPHFDSFPALPARRWATTR